MAYLRQVFWVEDRHPKSTFLWSGKAVSNGSLSRSVARRDKALRIFLWFSSTMGQKKSQKILIKSTGMYQWCSYPSHEAWNWRIQQIHLSSSLKRRFPRCFTSQFPGWKRLGDAVVRWIRDGEEKIQRTNTLATEQNMRSKMIRNRLILIHL